MTELLDEVLYFGVLGLSKKVRRNAVLLDLSSAADGEEREVGAGKHTVRLIIECSTEMTIGSACTLLRV